MRGRSGKPHSDRVGDDDLPARPRRHGEGGRPAKARGPGSVAQAHESIETALRAGRPTGGVQRAGVSGSESGVVLYSPSGTLSNSEVLARNVGLPRSMDTVRHYAALADVDFRGAVVEIVESGDDVAYLDFQGAAGRTDALGVQLGPAAFQDEETLVRTLGHESVHVRQHQEGQISTLTGPLEDEAYEAEDGFVAAWRSNRR